VATNATINANSATADASFNAPTLFIPQLIEADQALATAQMRAPVVSGDAIVVVVGRASATGSMPPQTVRGENVTSSPIALATALFRVPVIDIAAGIVSALATAAAQMLAPSVDQASNIEVSADEALATALMLVPHVDIDIVVFITDLIRNRHIGTSAEIISTLNLVTLSRLITPGARMRSIQIHTESRLIEASSRNRHLEV
jgi:hypothetical protein